MKPTHNDPCAAIVILGGERFAKDEIRPEELEELVRLGLVCYEEDDWWITYAGELLLPDLVDGNPIQDLI